MSNSLTFYRAPMLPGNDVGNVTTETQLPNGRATPLLLQLPSNGSLANKSFRVRVAGRVQSAINATYDLKVYFGLSATISKNTLIFDSAQQTITGKSNFEFWLDMQWDNDSKTITGRGAGSLANNVLGPTTLINVPISADPFRDNSTFLASGATYGFTLTGQFGTGDSGNHCRIDSFALEAV